jgi:hypothetical protein
MFDCFQGCRKGETIYCAQYIAGSKYCNTFRQYIRDTQMTEPFLTFCKTLKTLNFVKNVLKRQKRFGTLKTKKNVFDENNVKNNKRFR